jgi:hypothetical protein
MIIETLSSEADGENQSEDTRNDDVRVFMLTLHEVCSCAKDPG